MRSQCWKVYGHMLFLKSFFKSETDHSHTSIKTYRVQEVQEYSEFKNLLPCFAGNANVVNSQSERLP